MSNTFSFARFAKVLHKDMSDSWKKIIFAVLMVSSVMVVLFIFDRESGESLSSMERLIEIALTSMLVPVFLIFDMYGGRNLPKTGRNFAMLPATPWEKYVSMAVLNIVLLPMLLLVTYFVVDTLLTLVMGRVFDHFLWQTDLHGRSAALVMLLVAVQVVLGTTNLWLNFHCKKKNALIISLVFVVTFIGVMGVSVVLAFDLGERVLDAAGVLLAVALPYGVLMACLTCRRIRRCCY